MKYQIAYRPLVPTGIWSLRAHGARHDKEEATEAKERLEANGYEVVMLPFAGGAIEMSQKIRKERITKREWYGLGGFANPALFRQQSRGGAWRYYVSLDYVAATS